MKNIFMKSYFKILTSFVTYYEDSTTRLRSTYCN